MGVGQALGAAGARVGAAGRGRGAGVRHRRSGASGRAGVNGRSGAGRRASGRQAGALGAQAGARASKRVGARQGARAAGSRAAITQERGVRAGGAGRTAWALGARPMHTGWANWVLVHPAWFFDLIFNSVMFLSHRLNPVHEHCS